MAIKWRGQLVGAIAVALVVTVAVAVREDGTHRRVVAAGPTGGAPGPGSSTSISAPAGQGTVATGPPTRPVLVRLPATPAVVVPRRPTALAPPSATTTLATALRVSTPAGSAALQRALQRWVSTTPGMGSAAVAVVIGGQLWAGDARAASEADPDIRAGDVYPIASLTKSFTIGLVLRAADAGAIDLDAPVPALPGVTVPADGPAATITPRELLQHTSGLVDYSLAPGFDADRLLTPADAVDLSLDAPLQATPGTDAHYANSNYLWLGLLLEQVTGRSFADLVEDEAQLVGLTDTALDPTEAPGRVGFSSGGLRSTVADVARWELALATPGTIVSAPMVTALGTIDAHGVGLGTWPLCPCAPGADGLEHAVAMGHYVAEGGSYRYPDGMILIVHDDPAGANSEAAIVALGEQLRTALHL
jgi:CubicO group peptidase (beta-lactamase class C family)